MLHLKDIMYCIKLQLQTEINGKCITFKNYNYEICVDVIPHILFGIYTGLIIQQR